MEAGKGGLGLVWLLNVRVGAEAAELVKVSVQCHAIVTSGAPELHCTDPQPLEDGHWQAQVRSGVCSAQQTGSQKVHLLRRADESGSGVSSMRTTFQERPHEAA